MYTMAITDTWLKANSGKLREKIEVISDRDSLSVRASVKGKLVFQLRYRLDGKQKRMDLGSYPSMSLKKAREEATRLRAELEQGRDPFQVKIQDKLEYKNQYTVKQLIEEWHEKEGCKKISGKDIYRSMELYLYPALQNFYHDDLEINHWLVFLEEVARSVPAIAIRILTNVKNAQRWGVRRGLIKKFTLQHITAKADLNISKNKTTRNLNDQEIYFAVWATILSKRMHPKNKALVLLSLFYGCRIGELRLCQKDDFDFEKHIWIVPAENHKTGRLTKQPIVRPMIPEIERFIRQIFMLSGSRKKYVFGLLDKNVDMPMTQSSHLSIPDRVITQVRSTFKVEMQHWSMHDLRRTMRTHMSEFAEPYLCEMMVGHALPTIWGTYDYYKYVDEQKVGYEKWFKRIIEILNNHEDFALNGFNPTLPDSFSHFLTNLIE